MSNRNDGEVLFWLCLIGLAFVGWQVYLQVKVFAEWMHLDWSSAACLLAGILALVAGVVLTWLKDGPLSKLFPWMLCGFYPFVLPALNYWSLSVPGRLFPIDGYNYGSAAEVAWYGNGWWQLLMFIALLGIAYSVNKWQNEHY